MNSLILLAAGLSVRFGSHKALVNWYGQPLIVALQTMLLSSSLDEIIIVLGAEPQSIEPHLLKHAKIKVVHNKDYKLGQTSSFQTGLRALSSSSMYVGLLPVDYPCVQCQTIERILKTANYTQTKILIPKFHGQKGHPPFFSVTLREEILNLSTSLGLNSLFPLYTSATHLMDVDDPGVVATFNTPQELTQIQNSIT